MKEIQVTGALIKKNDKYLIGRRGPNEKSPGLWEFPGGKIEKGETPIQCIKRELKEELNINAEIGDLVTKYSYDYPNVSYLLHFFKINSYTGEFKMIAHDKLKWVALNDFHKYDFLQGDTPLINQMLSNNLS